MASTENDDFPTNSLSTMEYTLSVSDVDKLEEKPFTEVQNYLGDNHITFKIFVDPTTKKITMSIATDAEESKEYKLQIIVAGQEKYKTQQPKVEISKDKPFELPFPITFKEFCKSQYVIFNSSEVTCRLNPNDELDLDDLDEAFSTTNTGTQYSNFNYANSYYSNPQTSTAVATYSSKEATGFVGLQNQGATCYMNSLLQSLYNLPAFRKIVYEIPTTGNEDEKKSIPLNLQRLFCEMQLGKEACSTRALTISFGWGSTETFMQHDIEEFNRVLIDNLETKLKGTQLQNSIADLFKGKYRNYIRCRNVDFTSSREEDFYDLQMVVKGCPNLRESFKQYTASDELVGDNQYEAEGFGKQDADMGIEFIKFPTVLQLHLNRFEYDYNYDRMTKINDKFEFPEEIDLSEFLAKDADHSKSSVYELFGVLVHSGSASFGHYYAFLRPSTDKQWYEFNDSRVSKVDKDKAIEDNFGGESSTGYSYGGYSNYYGYSSGKYYSAYILVYVRKNEANNVFQPIPDEAVPPHLKEYMERPKPQQVSYYNSLDVTVMTEDNFAEGTVELKKIFNKLDKEKKFQISKDSTNAELYKTVSEELKVDIDEIRLWKQKTYYNTPSTIIDINDEKIDLYYYSYSLDVYCQIKGKDEPLLIPDGDIVVYTKFFFPKDEYKLQFVKEVQIKKDATLQELSEKVNKIVGFPEGTKLKCYTESIDQKASLKDDMEETLEKLLVSTGSVVIFQLAKECEDLEPTLLKKKTPSDFASLTETEKEQNEAANSASKEVKIEANAESLPLFSYSDESKDSEPLSVAKYFINNNEMLEYILCDINDTTNVIGRIQFPTDVLFEDIYKFIAKIAKLDYDPEKNALFLFRTDYYDDSKPNSDFIDTTYNKTPKTVLYRVYNQNIKKLFFYLAPDIPQAQTSNYTTKRIIYSSNGYDLTFDRPIIVEKTITKVQDLVDSLISRNIIPKIDDSYLYLKTYKNDVEDLYKPDDDISYTTYTLRIQPQTADITKSIFIARGTLDRTDQHSPSVVHSHLPFLYELPEGKTRKEIVKEIQDICKYSDQDFAKLRFMYKDPKTYQLQVLPNDGELQDILKPLYTLYLIERS